MTAHVHTSDLVLDGTSLVLLPGDSLELQGCSVRVINGGSLEAYAHDPANPITISWTGINSAGYVGGGMGFTPSDPGLWVGDGGRLVLEGARVTPWGLARYAAGSTIVLDRDPVGWRVGGRVSVCPSRSKTEAGGYFFDEFDECVIQSIQGRIVTLTAPMTYPHPVFVDPDTSAVMGPEVLYLDRSLVLDGGPNHGPHLHVHGHDGPRPDISFARLSRMGHRDVLGRYPLHIHHVHGRTAGAVYEGVIVEGGHQHAFVTHMSEHVTWRECVAYDTRSDAFWWDKLDPSDGVAYERCVAAKVRHETEGRLTGFILGRGVGTRITDCRAVGVARTNQGDSSGFSWPEFGPANPDPFKDYASVWAASGCVSHGNRDHGLFVWQNDADSIHSTSGFAVWHVGRAGIRSGAYAHIYQHFGLRLVGRETGADSVGIWIEAGSRTVIGQQQTWADTDLSDFDIGIRISPPNLEPTHPVLVLRPRFHRVGKKVQLKGNLAFPFGQRVDIVCAQGHDIEPTDVEVVSAQTGTVLRVQRASGTAWQMDAQGSVTTIGSFWP